MTHTKQPKVANNVVSTVTESTETTMLKLKQVTWEDFLKVKRLPYRKKRCNFKEFLPEQHCFIATGDDNDIKGVVTFSYCAQEKRIHILFMEVVSHLRGRGYGPKILEALKNYITEIHPPLKVKIITLRCKSGPAKFWRSQGFEPALDTDMGGLYRDSELTFYSKRFEHKPPIINTVP